jgi:UDP-N-acetylmuramoyl-L-alanyl-D-glutamate--2,6-diaminopimelate ligase
VAGGETMRPEHPHPLTVNVVAHRLGVEVSGAIATSDSVLITGVSGASSETRPGDIFFGLPGARTHGATYAPEAISAGAVAVVTDAQGFALAGNWEVPVLVVTDPRAVLGSVSSWIYGSQNADLEIYGVTGTNGKTTVVYMLASLLEKLGFATGFSSTSERRIGSETLVSGLTTPESNHVHALLGRMIEKDVQAAVLEVSAHALTRHRVDGVHFDVVGFANFSQDHLDDYASMEAYFEAKAALFTPERAKRGVVVIDSEWGRKLAAAAGIPVSTIGLAGTPGVDWTVEVLDQTPTSTRFRVADAHGHSLEASVSILGEFSALNAALSIVMTLEAGHSFESIAQAFASDSTLKVDVPGRTEIVSGDRGPLVFVDYGHTPEAFAQTLRAVRAVVPGKVIMVFGADGDRDTTKRGEMGAVSARNADVVIITDFHPRSEDPQAIRAALLAGAHAAESSADIREVADPAHAVRLAISLAAEGDAILYAGPGHEDYRDLGTSRVDYNAREDTKLALKEAGWLS